MSNLLGRPYSRLVAFTSSYKWQINDRYKTSKNDSCPMNEVSCRNTYGYIYYFRNFTDIPVEELFGDLPYDFEHLENPRNWIDWNSYLIILKRLRRYYPTREDIIDFAIDLNYKTGKYHPITKLIGLAVSPLSLYKLGWKWLAPGLMKTLKCRYEMDDRRHIRMIAEIDPQYEGDTYLGYVTEGLFINYPSFLVPYQ